MIRQIIVTSLLLFAAACNTTTTTRNDLKPRDLSNQVAKANLSLGIEYMRRGSYEKALEKLGKAKQADPDFYATYNAYGLLYQQLGELELAERNFKRALSLGNFDSGTLNNYGRFLCQSGRFEEAIDVFERAAANPLYETPEVAYANAGICSMRAGDRNAAESYNRRALEINPRVPSALLQMADISLSEGNYLSARGYLQRFLAVSKHSARSLWLGIQIESQLSDKNAVASYALLLRSNFPDSEETKLLDESGLK